MKPQVIAIAACATIAGVALAQPASAEPVVLKYGTGSPPTAAMTGRLAMPWAEQTSKLSGGALEIQVFAGPSLINLQNSYDRTINGVADMAFMILGPVSSQFPKTAVATLPFEVSNAAEAGAALWALFQNGVIADELEKVKPLAIGAFPNVSVHAKKPVITLNDLRGMKLSVQSRLMGEAITALGATPITMPVTELYQALSRGVIDGTAIGWPATTTYKTHEVVSFHTDVPLGGEVAFEIMNKQSYERLPDAAKRAIDQTAGAPYTKSMGEIIDIQEQESRAIITAAGQKILTLAPAEQTLWQQRIAPITEAWVKSTPNGAAVLATFRQEVAKYRKGVVGAQR